MDGAKSRQRDVAWSAKSCRERVLHEMQQRLEQSWYESTMRLSFFGMEPLQIENIISLMRKLCTKGFLIHVT